MIVNFDKDTVLSFKIMLPAFLPFYNQGNVNVYYKYEAFDLDPFNIKAASTSGSPVLITPNAFFGFLDDRYDGRFAHDGRGNLTVTCPKGQSLYYCESCDPYAEWEKYNKIILEKMPKQKNEKFWGELEYCTWNEQKRWQREGGLPDTQAPLNEKLVYSYMDRIEKLGLPKGKLTIDDGWDVELNDDGKRIFGNWEINREKFPNMEKLVRDMTDRGFIPGLWFAPFIFTEDCELAKAHPEVIGSNYSADPNFPLRWKYILDNDVLDGYFYGIFKKYIDIGFRKFKLDIAYGYKRDMKALLSRMYRIIKEIESTVEVECHIPDIFVSEYSDTVRLNDVNLDPEGKWRGLTQEHYKVCRYSSPHKILNLDHLGTNTAVPEPKFFLEHSHMILELDGGYPCVSLLPDCYSPDVQKEFVEAVKQRCDK
jgi:hypothetical protein